MSKTILLGVDALHCAPEPMEMTRELCGADDKVIVFHVHEFAIGRFGRLQVDCPVGEAERLGHQQLAAGRPGRPAANWRTESRPGSASAPGS